MKFSVQDCFEDFPVDELQNFPSIQNIIPFLLNMGGCAKQDLTSATDRNQANYLGWLL
jgi:hypothetical protein